MSYYVYIMINPTNKVIYTGVTNDLIRRVYEHRNKLVSGFTRKYNIVKLVYYEIFPDPQGAIAREKALKGSSRSRKIKLIEGMNPLWRDLWEEITQ
ncbi:GIY-YIG nuclease family protein [bacterium]|nr:GIY-YIG nuclease family protein [bacterium]